MEQHLTTENLVTRCANSAILLDKLHTEMGRARVVSLGSAAATELRRRFAEVPAAWEAVERRLEGI